MTPELTKEILQAYKEGTLAEVFWSGWQISAAITLNDYATSVVEYNGKYYKLRHSRSHPIIGSLGGYVVATPEMIGEVVKKERVQTYWDIVK